MDSFCVFYGVFSNCNFCCYLGKLHYNRRIAWNLYKQRKIKAREARAEYLRGLPNEISALEQYLGEAIKILRNKRLSNETKLQKAIEQLGESGYFSTEEE